MKVGTVKLNKLLAQGIILVVAVGLLLFSILQNKTVNQSSSLNAPESSVSVKIPAGPQTYKIASSEGTIPKFVEAKIDRPDVHVGDTQKFEITVTSPNGIEAVNAEIGTDAGVKKITLSRFAVEKAADEQLEIWVGEWGVEDTHDKKYFTEFIAEDGAGNKSSITLSWTDACGIPLSGGWSISSYGNCGIFSTDGVENGNVTIDGGYTLTLNAPFGWNSGYSVSLVSGAIAVGSGGQLINSYIYVTDADADGYMANSTQYLSSASGKRRRSLMASWTLDCNDGNGYIYQNVADVYLDSDQDSYSSGSGSTQCVGDYLTAGYTRYVGSSGGLIWILGSSRNTDCNNSNSSAWYYGYIDNDGDGYGGAYGCNNGAASGGDCCDSDSNARPGQTGWFTSPRVGCGGYDYNCNSGTEYAENNATDCYLARVPDNKFFSRIKEFLVKTVAAFQYYGWYGGNPGCGNSGPFNWSSFECEGFGGEPYKISACH